MNQFIRDVVNVQKRLRKRSFIFDSLTDAPILILLIHVWFTNTAQVWLIDIFIYKTSLFQLIMVS